MSGLYDDFNSKIMEAVVRKKSQHRMSANAPPSTAATVDAQVHTDPQVASKGIFSDLDMNVAVFISADCSGMNAAVRAVVRMGLYVGCNVYLINEGYQGMIDGGDFIQLAEWKTVSNIIQKGGTIIGSAKCDEFRTREGRLKAAFNLVDRNIINLVCIGGDGSLTGANLFQEEWKGLLEELVREGRIAEEKAVDCSHLNIVGIVGSIDNDFYGTDMMIGTDSALHRIIEAIDNIVTTASSHQRCFVLEVMGKHCGYLAIVAALAAEADWVFIPEWPPGEGWENDLCNKLVQERKMGRRLNIIIVSEGAVDRDLNPITPEFVRNLVATRLNYDTRVTILGHVQRGGRPSAFDIVLGCRMGAEAILALMDATPDTPACVISLDGNQIVRVPLAHCVARTLAAQAALDAKRFKEAVLIRGRNFRSNLDYYRHLNKTHPPSTVPQNPEKITRTYNVGVMNVGSPACGMNAAVRACVRLGIANGYPMLGIRFGFEGLVQGHVTSLSWTDVQGWAGTGGSRLGTTRSGADEVGLDKIASQLRTLQISGLIVIGGFEAFHSVLALCENREKFPEFCIPMVVIPAVISNNVPGTDFSLGADTSLNEIADICDRIKQSASGTRTRVFVVETMGGYCGYLATMSALAGGADAAYIYEEPFSIEDLQEDVSHMVSKIKEGVKRGLILRNEKANINYTTEFIHQLFREEGKDIFSCRMNVLGHMQQGGSPSPFDRNVGTKMAAKCIHKIIQQIQEAKQGDGSIYTDRLDTATLLGLIGKHNTFTPVEDLKLRADFEHRIPMDNWWLKLRPLLRILAKHESVYETQSVVGHTAEIDTEMDKEKDTVDDNIY